MNLNQDNNIFFKCRFFSESQVCYGVFYYIIKPDGLFDVLRFNVLVSRFKFFLTNNFTPEYVSGAKLFDIEVKMRKIKEQNEYHVLATNKINSELNSFFNENSEERRDFFNLIDKKKEIDLSYKLQYLFKKILNTNDISFEFIFDQIPTKEIESISEDLYDKENQELKKNLTKFETEIISLEKNYSKDFNIISGTFILAPYSGISIRNLKSGDPVLLYLALENNKKYNFDADEYENQYDTTNAVSGIIDKIISGPINQSFFLIQINRHTYARVLETENFNVKTSPQKKDEILDKIFTNPSDNQYNDVPSKFKVKKEVFLSVLGVFFILIILYILFY